MKMHTKALVGLLRETVATTTTIFRGAEIGVFRGENSQELLNTFPNLELTLVDLWKEWPKGTDYFQYHSDMGKLPQSRWDEVYREAVERTSPFSNRVLFKRMSSEVASSMEADGHFDFVFIDANHTYPGVKKDLGLWIEKIRIGGLVCGHDYGGRCRGVAKAVDETFGKENLLLRRGLIWGAIRK